MSDKDLVKEAALRALMSPKVKLSPKAPQKAKRDPGVATPSKPAQKTEKKANKSERDSAKAASHKHASQKKSIRLSEPETALPEKGGAEAAVHNLAAKAAKGEIPVKPVRPKDPESGGYLFLAIALALPLLIVAGVYYYEAYELKKTTQAVQKQISQTSKSASKARSATSTGASPHVVKAAVTSKNSKNSGTVADHAAPPTPHETPASGKSANIAPHIATKPDAGSPHKPHWDYKALNWASLDPSFKTCGTGLTQSPINIEAKSLQTGPNFQYNYFPSKGEIHNNGHSIQIDLTKSTQGFSNQLLVNGQPYDLIQFHFHTPSENHINGHSFPMEVHLVHKNAQGQLAVVAIMINGNGNNQLLDHMPLPAKKGDRLKSDRARFNPAFLLPNNRSTFTFTGSLTTPPCSENVGWIVMKSPISVSPATLLGFQKILGKNNRPLQASNNRAIYSGN